MGWNSIFLLLQNKGSGLPWPCAQHTWRESFWLIRSINRTFVSETFDSPNGLNIKIKIQLSHVCYSSNAVVLNNYYCLHAFRLAIPSFRGSPVCHYRNAGNLRVGTRFKMGQNRRRGYHSCEWMIRPKTG